MLSDYSGDCLNPKPELVHHTFYLTLLLLALSHILVKHRGEVNIILISVLPE